MKTLNKNITSRFFATESGYVELKARWSKIMQDPEARKALNASHHALYAGLMGKDWRKGFSAPKVFTGDSISPEAILTGLPYWVRSLSAKPTLCFHVLGDLVPGTTSGYRRWESREIPNPFFGLLSEEAMALLGQVIPDFNEQYLPAEAYKELEG